MSISQVPLLDLKRIHDPIEMELKAAFERVLHKNSYIMGPEVLAFETACAEYLEVEHALGVSSGTDALLLAMMALDIGPDDEVIVPTYTFFATAGCVWRLGAKPVFVDIEPDTFNLSLDTLKKRVNTKTKAIIPVHLFGQSVDLDPILEFAAERNIPVIEDAAQAIGTQYKGKKVGGLGAFGCFSFFPAKNLGAFGDGGLVTTQDSKLAEKARILRTHGAKPKYHHHYVGGNFRLDALQAALLGVKLPYLDGLAAQRQANALRYHERFRALDLPLTLPQSVSADDVHVYNQYVIKLESEETRDDLKTALAEKKIGHAIYYPIPLHLQGCFEILGYMEGDLPVSEEMAKTTLALPVFPGMTEAEQDYVIKTVGETLG